MNRIYDMYKGETYIDSGTIDFLAKKYRVKRETMAWRTKPCAKKRDKGNATLLYLAIEEAEDE